MKVTSNYLQEVYGKHQRPEQNKVSDSSFANLLKESQGDQGQTSRAVPGVDTFMGNSVIGQLMATQQIAHQGGLKTPEAQLEQTLTAMEQYAQALGNPGKTLKDIAPLAEELSQEAGLLSQISQGLAGDNPLKKLSNDTAILATVEAMKFKRGDFV